MKDKKWFIPQPRMREKTKSERRTKWTTRLPDLDITPIIVRYKSITFQQQQTPHKSSFNFQINEMLHI